MFLLNTENKIIYDPESINMWIWDDKNCHLLIFRISGHHDVIIVSYWNKKFKIWDQSIKISFCVEF